jgi:ribosomal protein S18 acetylase RimI-like enzyme
MIDIRLAHKTDAPELAKLNDLFNGDGNNTVEAIVESLKGNEQELVCVAADGDKLVGFCCGQILKSMCYSYKFAEITELYVIDEYRRQGIGKQLLGATENELNKRGVKHLHVLTGDKNFIAQTLYHSCGYGDTSEILLDKNMEG